MMSSQQAENCRRRVGSRIGEGGGVHKATAEVLVVRGVVNKRKLITERCGGQQTSCETQPETDGKQCSRGSGRRERKTHFEDDEK